MAETILSADDPVLAALRATETQYRNVVEDLRQECESKHQELAQASVQVQQAKAGAEQQRQRAKQLEEALREIHNALFSGNLYELILRVCLKLTDSTRGLYVAVETHGAPRRIRAAVDVGGYPAAPASAFLESLCLAAANEGETLVYNKAGDIENLPHPAQSSENFRNFIAAPVILMRGLSGVIIAADKQSGDFDSADVQTLLHIGDQAAVAVENAHLRQKLQNAYLATVSVLADAMEAKDPYTQGHCEIVSRYARRIARRLHLTQRELSIVSYAALLHDIGKIGVSDGILNKPGPLLPEERELVRSHVRVGHDLIRHVPALSVVADAVLHHHEWYDGTGYPDGLRGENIPIASRIVCVVDSFGAMISRRSYKEAYGVDYARAELSRCAGTQFDPQIVEVFLDVLSDKTPETGEMEEDEEAGLAPLPDFLPVGDSQIQGTSDYG